MQNPDRPYNQNNLNQNSNPLNQNPNLYNNQAPNPYVQNLYNNQAPNQYNQPPNQYNQPPPNQYNQPPPNQYNQTPYNPNTLPQINPNQYNHNQNINNKEYQPFKDPNKKDKHNNLINLGTDMMKVQKGFKKDTTSDKDSKPFDFKDKNVRLGFIRKVYYILTSQLLLTVIFVIVAHNSLSFNTFQIENIWLFYVCLVISIICMYALGCYQKIARKVPLNYILLLVFTLCESYIVSFIASRYDRDTVLIAASLTAAMTIGLTLYAIFTKTDFTTCGGILMVCCVCLIFGGILSIFFHNKWLRLILAILGVILFGIYLVYDTQLVIGKNKNKYSIDDYIMAAMNLYIDIIQIFLYLLQIVGAANN